MTTTDDRQSKTVKPKKKEPFWLIYIALLLAGVLLLADAFQIAHLSRWTAKFGIALVFSALALIVSSGRKSGSIAVAIVWIALIASYII
ncbi:MAG: hypothetical protein JSV52_00830 [Candidatus Zixiibacteriota bacterium]|nr:MAG: hypothetical protein JSV52_00830 [candidate division Zixibacteria bacterium]